MTKLTPADRKKARKTLRIDLGALRDNRVKPTTFRRYLFAAIQFQLFLIYMALPAAITMEELDHQLCGFLEYLWQEGEAKGLAADSISSSQHFLLTRRQFPGAWALFSVWGRLEMPNRAVPLTLDMILALAGWAASQAHLEVAALLLVGFHCSLRTMEMLGICPQALCLGTDARGAVALPLTKMGQQRGAQESVTIDDPLPGFWLFKACLGKGLDSPILPCSPSHFRNLFKKGLEVLGLADQGFTPYSIRRGGATHDFAAHGSVARTMLRGRWSDVRTARIYLTDGLATTTALRLSAGSIQQISLYKRLLLASSV
jgi:integrase